MDLIPKISFIVPVYNVENYLCRCIDSLLNQTYRNYDIILVDDGSRDNCPKICDKYAFDNSIIKVIHKANGGLSDARNIGLKYCDSEYAVFIDADDVVDSTMLEQLIEAKSRLKADIVCSPLIFEFPNGNRKHVNTFEEIVVDKVTAQAYILRSKYSGVTACAKLFPVNVLKKHLYPTGKINEDLRTTFLHFQEVKNVAFIPQAFYHYIQRENSISYAEVSFDTTMEAMVVCEQFMESSKNEMIKKACVNRIFQITGNFCASHRKISNDIRKELQSKLKKYIIIALKDIDNTKSEKIKFLLLSSNGISFKLFTLFQRLNKKRYI